MFVKTKIAIARGKLVCAKLVLVSLGLVIGATSMYITLQAPQYWNTSNTITIENKPLTIEAKPLKVETVEETISRMVGERKILIKVAQCESNFSQYATNGQGSSAKGVFQILDMHGLTPEERYNVATSTAWAIAQYDSIGLKPWVASQHCWSK